MKPRRKRPPLDRFQEKYAVADTGCWLWTASCYRSGYGQFYLEGRHQLAHRVAFRLLVGPIPEGLDLDHLCRVRHCVNPAHLEPVTRRTNLLRGQTTAARRFYATVCSRGHPLTGDNILVEMAKDRRHPRRRCRTCYKAAYQAHNARRSAARARSRSQ